MRMGRSLELITTAMAATVIMSISAVLWLWALGGACGGVMGQAGADLGERLKAEWEWAAVLGQVEVYGWTSLNILCHPRGPDEPICHAAAAHCLCYVCGGGAAAVIVLLLSPAGMMLLH